jgi:hypothetical protein
VNNLTAQHSLQRALDARDEVKRAREKLEKLEAEYYALTQDARTAAQALADAVIQDARYIALVGIDSFGVPAFEHEYSPERPS